MHAGPLHPTFSDAPAADALARRAELGGVLREIESGRVRAYINPRFIVAAWSRGSSNAIHPGWVGS